MVGFGLGGTLLVQFGGALLVISDTMVQYLKLWPTTLQPEAQNLGFL
jgi:hypothetical protein